MVRPGWERDQVSRVIKKISLRIRRQRGGKLRMTGRGQFVLQIGSAPGEKGV